MTSKRTTSTTYSSKTSNKKKTQGRKLTQRQKTQVKRIVGTGREEKYYVSNINAGVDYSGTITDLTQVVNGQNDITRNGDQITFKRLEWVCNVKVNAPVSPQTTSYNTVRMIIFQWRPLTTPVLSNIADTNSPNPISSVNAPYLMYNWDDKQQYKILYSRTFYVDFEHGPYTRKASGVLFGKKVSKRIRFNSTSATPGFNHLYVALVSDDGALTYPEVYFRSRLVYTDA